MVLLYIEYIFNSLSLAINKIEKNTSMNQSYKFYYVGKIVWN